MAEGNPTLTKILMASLVATFLIAITFGAYSEFIVLNNATIEDKYSEAFNTIGAQYGNFGNLAKTTSDQGLVKNIFSFGKNVVSGTVNVFVVGLDAIGSFFSMIPIISNVVESIALVIPGFQALLGLLTTLIVLYIGMRYIQSTSNKYELP
ncbi:MAG TPA: hypothetical protein PLU55_03255 [Candidatus Pacearchaeota archaeon]|jgi:hypothetical protein|nr:hypothetical protein [Candidatus Pacearchaeota archaeon]